MPSDLRDRLNADLKDAMRARDQTRLLTVRSLLAAVTAREKEGTGALSEDDLTAVVQKQAKQRRDSIEQFERAGREDLAERERAELAVVEGYLPAQLSDEEVRQAVEGVIARTGASAPSDIGRVMGEAMRELRGRADGARVREAAQSLLAG